MQLRARDVLLLCLLSASIASAQDVAPGTPERLYLSPGVLLGSHRMVAMGGAYTAIAEGIEGYPSNLAVLAHRRKTQKDNFDLSLTFGWLDIPLPFAQSRDLDNDGHEDNAYSNQLQGGMLIQYSRYGVGGFWRLLHQNYCVDAQCTSTVDMNMTTTSGGFAVALGRDDVIAGVGLYGASALLLHDGQIHAYSGTGGQFDLLVRPQYVPLRVGISVKPPVRAKFVGDQNNPPFVGQRAFIREVAVPGVVSLGVSFKVGEGATTYNRLSPAALHEIRLKYGLERSPPEVPLDAPSGRVLVSTQLDIISGVGGALPPAYFGTQLYSGVPVVGEYTLYQPRLGAEVEALPKRLRLRGGLYLEPSAFRDHGFRSHVTGGFELLLFHLLADWSLSSSVDFASKYRNFGLSIGFWQ